MRVSEFFPQPDDEPLQDSAVESPVLCRVLSRPRAGVKAGTPQMLGKHSCIGGSRAAGARGRASLVPLCLECGFFFFFLILKVMFTEAEFTSNKTDPKI